MKLPVVKAFGATYSFVFGHLFSCIQIVWLPLAILYAAVYWLANKVLPLVPQLISQIASIKEQATPDPQAVPYAILKLFAPLMHYQGLFMLLSLIIFSIICAGLLRLVIRGEKPRLPFYIGFGGDELRLIFTWILFGLLLAVACIGGAIGVVILAVAGAAISKPLAAAAAGIAYIILILFLLWLVLRLSLAGAGAVAVRGIGLGPSWKASKGNSLNLLGFWILVLIPVIVIGMVAGWVISATLLPEFLALSMSFPAHDTHPDPQQVADAMTKILGIVQAKLPLLLGVSYVMRLVTYPILICAGGVAYRLITEDDKETHAH